MRFNKRMNPIIKYFDGIPYEATDWFKTGRGASAKATEYAISGFITRQVYETYWPGYFVYVTTSEIYHALSDIPSNTGKEE